MRAAPAVVAVQEQAEGQGTPEAGRQRRPGQVHTGSAAAGVAAVATVVADAVSDGSWQQRADVRELE